MMFQMRLGRPIPRNLLHIISIENRLNFIRMAHTMVHQFIVFNPDTIHRHTHKNNNLKCSRMGPAHPPIHTHRHVQTANVLGPKSCFVHNSFVSYQESSSFFSSQLLVFISAFFFFAVVFTLQKPHWTILAINLKWNRAAVQTVRLTWLITK